MLLILVYLLHSLSIYVLSLPGNTASMPAVAIKCRLRGSDSSASAIISYYSTSTPCSSSSESVVYTSTSICSTTRVNSKSGSSSSKTALIPTSQSIESSKSASSPSVTMTSSSWPSASSTGQPLQTQSIDVSSSARLSTHRSSSAQTKSLGTETVTGSQETPYHSKSPITSTVVKSQFNVPSITYTDSSALSTPLKTASSVTRVLTTSGSDKPSTTVSTAPIRPSTTRPIISPYLPRSKSVSSSRPRTTIATRTRKPSTSASVTQSRVPESATPSTPIQFPPSYNPNYPTWQPPPVPAGFSSMEEYKLWWMNPDYESKPFLKKTWWSLPSPFPPGGEPPQDDTPSFDIGTAVGGDGSPLIFDMNNDGKVSAKRGVGITLEPEDVNDRDGGAVDGDKMLAMSDINGNGVIDIEEVFGNFTISPFTRKPYKAPNGFVALELLAKELLNNGCDGAFQNVSMVDLQAVRKCLRQKLNLNFGFIARNNVKIIEPLGIAMYVDVKNYLETPGDYQDGILHAQKGQFIKTDGSTGKVHDVWF
ncbi:hypothetical protein MIR68_004448 [Amoeboaphelidium protococcarum]|nr:hypothetical protein MIR68_004448 [Amoeboaphelidium protococcarum]